MINDNIDYGSAFDWSKTSNDYGRYRDIYPDAFYAYLREHNIGIKGQDILDLGTGTGVIPRNLYDTGANFTGIDIAEGQINQAKALAAQKKMNIQFACSSAEDWYIDSPTYDVVTACQCFEYFQHDRVAEKIYKILLPHGCFALMYMAWLPNDDVIAQGSEQLVLKFNPQWTGNNRKRQVIEIPNTYKQYFDIESSTCFDVYIPFTKDTWNGRMKTCRGIEASLSQDKIDAFHKEHMQYLNETVFDPFTILHYCTITVLRKKD